MFKRFHHHKDNAAVSPTAGAPLYPSEGGLPPSTLTSGAPYATAPVATAPLATAPLPGGYDNTAGHHHRGPKQRVFDDSGMVVGRDAHEVNSMFRRDLFPYGHRMHEVRPGVVEEEGTAAVAAGSALAAGGLHGGGLHGGGLHGGVLPASTLPGSTLPGVLPSHGGVLVEHDRIIREKIATPPRSPIIREQIRDLPPIPAPAPVQHVHVERIIEERPVPVPMPVSLPAHTHHLQPHNLQYMEYRLPVRHVSSGETEVWQSVATPLDNTHSMVTPMGGQMYGSGMSAPLHGSQGVNISSIAPTTSPSLYDRRMQY